MDSVHRVVCADSSQLDFVPAETVDLVLTSPPYPMIEMWDHTFATQDPEIAAALRNEDGNAAFDLMHKILDKVWEETYRVLRPGGFACINIGDATRSMARHFRLYPNHARILQRCLQLGFSNLPAIIWRKQTNAPNKFMGSGMLPAGAYVTLEHEFILILRKGNSRAFLLPEEKANRRGSALFWEERNNWYSDVWWDLKGTSQHLAAEAVRKRSGAFPFELAYRLINMYSVKGDTVLDPFLGTGTTTFAAIASNRNSIGVEIDPNFKDLILQTVKSDFVGYCNNRIRERLADHMAFVEKRKQAEGYSAFKYVNTHYGCPVMTRQEVDLVLDYIEAIELASENHIRIIYSDVHAVDYFEKGSLFHGTNASSKNSL